MRSKIKELIARYPILISCEEDILNSYFVLENSYINKGKLLIAGNGGSASDADHIVGELMKSFKKRREISGELQENLKRIDSFTGAQLIDKLQQGLPAIALNNHQSLNTAFINDVINGGEFIYAQQVLGYGNSNDVLLAISTSGNSKNVYYACVMAKAKGMKIIALSGKDGGLLKNIADINIIVPSNETYLIQELHLPIYHWLCLMLEDRFF